MYEKELKTAMTAAVEAGEEILKIYNDESKWKVTYKEGNMPLTAADKAANHVILNHLHYHFPGYAVLSEEQADDKLRLNNEYCFVVDPLDGTKEFIKRNGQFTVNIALSYRQKTVMGVIYVPVSGELYYASKGNGAYKRNKDKTEDTMLKVSDITDLNEVRVVMSSSHGCKEMDELIKKYGLKNVISIGSSLKGCLIAAGEAEIYYRFNPTMEWDTAAMQCIVEEAGGIFRQMDDTEMYYNRENSLNEKGFYIINCADNKL